MNEHQTAIDALKEGCNELDAAITDSRDNADKLRTRLKDVETAIEEMTAGRESLLRTIATLSAVSE